MDLAYNIRIFLADNDKSVTELLTQKMLEHNNNYKIVSFNDTNELIDYFSNNNTRKTKSNYLILDYYMHSKDDSNLSGLPVIKTLIKNAPCLKIILFSTIDSSDKDTFEQLKKEEPNIIDFVKKSNFSYTYLQNIIRFDFAKTILRKKRKRLRWSIITFLVFATFVAIYMFKK